MGLKLVRFDTIQEGLRELGDTAPTTRQNLEARAKTPTLADGTNIWEIPLDSRTMLLEGGFNEDGLPRFKIDHDFDIGAIVDAQISQDGSVSIDEATYLNSKGAEFIVIENERIRSGAYFVIRAMVPTQIGNVMAYLLELEDSLSDVFNKATNYVIQARDYPLVRTPLRKGKRISRGELEEAGGFKMDRLLKPKEVRNGRNDKVHKGWLALAIGENSPPQEDYSKALSLVADYLSEAKKQGCFFCPHGYNVGMGFLDGIPSSDKAWPLCISGSDPFKSRVMYRKLTKPEDAQPAYFLR